MANTTGVILRSCIASCSGRTFQSHVGSLTTVVKGLIGHNDFGISRHRSSKPGGHCLHTSTSHQQQRVIREVNGETLIYSPYPDIQNVDTPFGDYMLSCLDEYKNLELLIDMPTGRTYTGAQLKECVIRVASSLARQGYSKGDVLLMFSTNSPEYTILSLACSVLGVVVSTANPVYTTGELSRQLSHCKASAIFTTSSMLPVVREAINAKQDVQERVKTIFTVDSADGCCSFTTLLEDDGKCFPENVDIQSDKDILLLPYSSGTTGLPKGVMLTHKNMVMNLIQAKEGQMKFRADEDVLLGLLPYFHIYGIMVLQFSVLTQGAKLIVMPKFEPETFLQSIQQYKISYAHVVPPISLFLAKHPMVDSFDLSSLNTVVSAAAPLGLGVTLEVEDRLGINMIQGYGMTELSPLTNYDEYPHKRGTVGQLIPSTVAKIVDTVSGRVMSPGETGELVITGPQVMAGYLDNPQATQDTIKDGWLYTGDIGHVDEEGYFMITDRLKELIKYKGYQVAPAELEAVLCTHPGILDAAVIGCEAGEEVGEVPKAFVVCKPGLELTDKDVIQFVEDNVAPYKRLRGGVEIIDEIPKTASGKILRRILRDRAN